jgi:hypothetical protein
MSGAFELTLQAVGAVGAITLRFAPLASVPLELTPVYRGMKGDKGEKGDVGDPADIGET